MRENLVAQPLSRSALVIVNARISTGDPMRPWADAILLRGERILAVGASAELRKRAGTEALVIDALGRMLLPHMPGDVLAAGRPASVILVQASDRDLSEAAARDAEIVLSILDGRIVLDRDSLAR